MKQRPSHFWLALIALFALSACDTASRDFSLAVSTEEPAPTVGEAVKTALVAHDFKITIETAADSIDVLRQLESGDIDLAIIEEPDQPVPGIVTLVPLYPSVLHIMHKREAGDDSFDNLIRGAKIYAGPTGGAAQQLLLQLAVDFDVPSDAFELLDNPWAVVPDVYFVFGGLLSAESTAQLDGYQLFSFAMEDDQVGATIADGIALRHHHLQPFVLPRNIYGNFSDRPILTLSIRSVLAANENMDSEVAHDIAYALFMNAQEISLPYPLVTRELNDNFDAANMMLPVHPGTRRFLDRDGPGFIERNVEVIALYFTFALTALSGLIALVRHRSQVRKDRVDEYQRGLLDIRAELQQSNADTIECRQRVIDLQGEVINLLIDERITADASLLSFLMQSNQLIGELDRR